MLNVILLSAVIITAEDAWECEGTEVFQDGTCQEPHLFDVCYDTEAASYMDDGQCFDVPQWCWADGLDTL